MEKAKHLHIQSVPILPLVIRRLFSRILSFNLLLPIMPQDSSLKHTPLYSVHVELGAKIVPFAGWNMPIQYTGLIQEHLAVRKSCGIFDVSHMGEVEITGKDAEAFLQNLIPNDVTRLQDESVLYSPMCYETGGVVDDLLIYRITQDRYMLCINASNTDKDFDWIVKNSKEFDVKVVNISDQTAQLAIQGPNAEATIQKLTDVSLKDIGYYHFKIGQVDQVECVISRTGYTGEDGFELYFDAQKAEDLFHKVMSAGKEFDIQPVGLGARDTLRLEVAYPLYGNELSAESNPLEAGLGWTIKLNKDNFIGKEALAASKEKGLEKKLVGLKLKERGVPRSHYSVTKDGQKVGEVTSGTFSPSLEVGVALALVDKEHSNPGDSLNVEIRKQSVPAEIVKLPFVPRNVKK